MNVKLRVATVGALFFVASQTAFAQTNKLDTTKVKDIDEVVVVAYGRQKKETVVGSNVQISAKDFEKRAITNISNVVEGAAPGVQVVAGSGQPGSGSAIRVRGFSTINASNAPLYVVDGVVFNGNVASLNPNDIESVNVLKDAASTSLYGSSAANGVVLITTKKGRKGRDVVNFSTSTGISFRGIPEYSRVGADDYYLLVWESLRNGYLYNPANNATVQQANTYASNNLITTLRNNLYQNVADNQVVVDGVVTSAAKKYNDLDWQKDLFNTGLRQAYDLNYSGGTEKTNYFASVGYLNEKGYLIKSDYERFTGRVSADSQFKPWLKVGMNIFGANSYGNNAVDGANNNSSLVNPYYFSRRMAPIYSPYLHNADGSLMYDSQGNVVYDYNQFGTTPRAAGAYTGRNAIIENILNTDFTKAFNVNARAFTEMKLLPDLVLTLNGGYDTRSTYNRSYTNNIVGDAAGSGTASRTNTTMQSVTFNQLLNYKKRFGLHNFDALVGHENNKYRYEYFYGYKRGQVATNNDDLINFITPASLTSTTDNYNKEAYFTKLNYDYAEKYILSGSFRRDASSRFAPENRWHNFWSLGAGWIISKEGFLKNSKFVNYLKLRGSYGEVGNDNGIGYYAYQNLFSLDYNNVGEPGVVFGTAADRNITWESNNQLDLGLEFRVADNRISGSVEWYKRETDGLLFAVPVPFSAGYPDASIYRNIGAMFNKGIEASLTLGIVRTEDLGWDMTINASTLHNEITKLPPGQPEIISGSKKYMVGRSIYDYWLYQWYGVDPTDGAGLFLLRDDLKGTAASDIRTVDGTEVTTSASKAKFDYSGTAIPDVFGSLNNTFRYRNVSLNTMFTYQFGGKIYDLNYAQLMSGFSEGVALHTDALNRWQKPGDITDVPRMDSRFAAQYNQGSSRWLTDASYIALRSAVLNYDFNKDVAQNFGLTSARIYVSGENLWSKTSRKGLEPQENFSGTVTNRYTPARIFSLGLNVSF